MTITEKRLKLPVSGIRFQNYPRTITDSGDGVPTPISQGGKPQTVKPVFTYKYNDKTRGVITKQINDAPNIHMFGTVVTSIGGGS